MKLYFYEIYETSCGIFMYEAAIFMNIVLANRVCIYNSLTISKYLHKYSYSMMLLLTSNDGGENVLI